MILAKDAVIAGYPVRVIQKALREVGRRLYATRNGYIESEVRKARRHARFDHDPTPAARESAAALWDALVADGLLVPCEPELGKEAFKPSPRALTIRNATIGSGFKRESAEKALQGFLDRCRQLEAPGSIYPYRVAAAILFGSHAAGKQIVGDVDILIQLDARSSDPIQQEKDREAFVTHMAEQGRSIPWDAYFLWPHQQTLTFLKGRSRILSLINLDESHLEIALNGPHRLVYADPQLLQRLNVSPHQLDLLQGASTNGRAQPSPGADKSPT